jgi:flavin reductase (DIM6/NTAB) family NADH-FMN oxidoreductase RutF
MKNTLTAAADPADFKAAFRNHPGGVSVITAGNRENPVALTATSLTSVSAEPPTIMFSLSDASSGSLAIIAAETVVVHLVGSQQKWLAQLAATSGVDRFADTSTWSTLSTGEPYYLDVTRWMRARITRRVPVAGATIIVAEVLTVEHSKSEGGGPLVYSNREWHTLNGESCISD